jgi:hypothetical protein
MPIWKLVHILGMFAAFGLLLIPLFLLLGVARDVHAARATYAAARVLGRHGTRERATRRPAAAPARTTAGPVRLGDNARAGRGRIVDGAQAVVRVVTRAGRLQW